MDEAARVQFLVAACHVGIIKADLIRAELESVSIALKGGLISPEVAVQWLRTSGLLEYFAAPVPESVAGKDE